MPPTMAQCESIIRARARFHAAWWNDARLGVSIGIRPGHAAFDQYLKRFTAAFDRFEGQVADRLTRDRRELFAQFMDNLPRLAARRRAGGTITIIHGDGHVWNCFLPSDGKSDDVRLFDWDAWRLGLGSDDLAYMMAVHWYPDMRHEREVSLLDHYHATLTARGVIGYDRRSLDEDYRLSVLWQLMTPVWQAWYNIPPVIWWNNLERVLLAVDDLDCRNLLSRAAPLDCDRSALD